MFSTSWLGSGYAFLASFAWGSSDFLGGLGAQRSNVYSVALFSQMSGLGFLALLTLVTGESTPPLGNLIWATGGGMVGMVGLLTLYHGLGRGKMGVVAPISGIVGAMLGVIASVFLDGSPSWFQVGGFGLGLLGVYLVSQTTSDGQPFRLYDILWGVIAGLCLGVFAISLDRIADEGLFFPLMVSRGASLLTMLIILGWVRSTPSPSSQNASVYGLFMGIGDTLGNMFYTLSAEVGSLAITSTMGALYPAFTILWARLLLHQRFNRVQWVGIALTLMAIVLLNR
ncbi:MAG: EamA family transporter [Phototrophicaceae bacterium]